MSWLSGRTNPASYTSLLDRKVLTAQVPSLTCNKGSRATPLGISHCLLTSMPGSLATRTPILYHQCPPNGNILYLKKGLNCRYQVPLLLTTSLFSAGLPQACASCDEHETAYILSVHTAASCHAEPDGVAIQFFARILHCCTAWLYCRRCLVGFTSEYSVLFFL